MTLEEFLEHPARNAWLEEPGISIYVRKGAHMVGYEALRCFDVANVHVHPNCQQQGLFTKWLAKAEALAADKFDALHVENVHNPHLWKFLERNGYTQQAHFATCYVKRLTS